MLGIPAGKLQDIFHHFTQADSSTTRKHGGTAPAISRRLTRLMGGSVGFETAQATGGLSFAGLSFLSFHSAVSPPLRLHPADLLALCGSHGP
jgi:K+-sensing histidine kinase KdpD